MMKKTVLIWFRLADLRIYDNPALYHAIKKAKDSGSASNVVALFVPFTKDWRSHGLGAVKIDFVLRSLKVLSADLWKHFKIPLLVPKESEFKFANEVIQDYVTRFNVSDVYYNREYEVNEVKRDSSIRDVSVHAYDGDLIIHPDQLLRTGRNMSVYSQFKKTWFETLLGNYGQYTRLYDPFSLGFVNDGSTVPDTLPDHFPGFELEQEKRDRISALFPAGEDYARSKLKDFLETKAKTYHRDRDIPILNGCSQLSPYMAAGSVSIKECFVLAMEKLKVTHGKDAAAFLLDLGKLKASSARNKKEEKNGYEKWIEQVIHKEFFKHIVITHPYVCKYKAFRQDYKEEWKQDENALQRWKEGRTGCLFIDAGMKQLEHEGFIDNRMRQVTAVYLTKYLKLDWRLGEAHFLEKLIDCDFAQNNGGWQWCASTGTDPMPYRYFNMDLQQKKYDPDQAYIKKWIPSA